MLIQKSHRKYYILFALVLCLSILLMGCGIGEKNERKLFEAMKDNGFLDLKCDYEDYDDVIQVDQSPIPAVTTYYEYHRKGKVYTLDYRTRILGDDDAVYQVRLTIDDGDESSTTLYFFDEDTFEFRKKQ